MHYSCTQKGATNDPANFRPITLESVSLKVSVPNEWKKVCTVLAHKKGDTMEPITLLSMKYRKVSSKIIRNSGTHFPTGSYHK